MTEGKAADTGCVVASSRIVCIRYPNGMAEFSSAADTPVVRDMVKRGGGKWPTSDSLVSSRWGCVACLITLAAPVSDQTGFAGAPAPGRRPDAFYRPGYVPEASSLSRPSNMDPRG